MVLKLDCKLIRIIFALLQRPFLSSNSQGQKVPPGAVPVTAIEQARQNTSRGMCHWPPATPGDPATRPRTTRNLTCCCWASGRWLLCLCGAAATAGRKCSSLGTKILSGKRAELRTKASYHR
ncbi:hypothetical protein BS78_03G266300 [Paspalum vaginatum]|nr:hypothetical protein BS78_03G266300 [Paspalum vaginatum]